MAGFDDSFRPFVILLKLFALEKFQVRKFYLKFIPKIYLVIVLMIIIYVSLMEIKTLFKAELELNANYRNFGFFIFKLDTLLYDLVTGLFYVNISWRRKHFKKFVKILKAFDFASRNHGVELNYRKLRNQSIKLLSLASVYYYVILVIYVAAAGSFLEAIKIAIPFAIYYIYIVELKFYIFLFWNIFVRLKKLQNLVMLEASKTCRRKTFQDLILQLDLMQKLVIVVNQGFSWNFLMILCKLNRRIIKLNGDH